MKLTFFENLIMKFPIDGNFDLLSATKNLLINNNSVLDIGFGEGGASLYFALEGKSVTSLGLELESYNYPKELFKNLNIFVEEILFEEYTTEKKFGLIWASHVIEHTLNPGIFLDKCWELLDDDGFLCIIVPPYKSQVVGGHVTTGWNIGQLMYNLVLKGFDIKKGHFIKHGYNLCAFVKKSKKLDINLRMDNGDIELLENLWPIDAVQGFEGNIDRINWFSNFKSYDSFEKKILKVEEQIKTIESKKEVIEEKNKELEERIKTIESKKEVIEEKNKELEGQIKTIESKKEVIKEKNKELEKLINIKNSAIEDLLRRI